jgi:hypothetical protein
MASWSIGFLLSWRYLSVIAQTKARVPRRSWSPVWPVYLA